jgi:acetyltransferase-like isoleucine patch superfamily enzyme
VSRTPRTLSWDWYPGAIPDNVVVDASAYIETTFCFSLYRSQADVGVSYGKGAASYAGTMFDVGRAGSVRIGEYALINGARFICDTRIDIGDYAIVSWNAVFMDSYRAATDPVRRRTELEEAARSQWRRLISAEDARPIRLERNVWIGFDVCVLPGVTIGEGSIVGARSVVSSDVPAFTVVAGNPARVIRSVNDER